MLTMTGLSQAARRRRRGCVVMMLLLCFIPQFLTEYEADFTTDGAMNSIMVNDGGIPVARARKLFLHVKGCGNAYMFLSHSIVKSEKSVPYYFIQLGSGNNRKINGIKESCFNCKEFKATKYEKVMDCNQYQKLWMTWDDMGSVRVGLGLKINERPLLYHTGSNAFTINYMTIMSSRYRAKWKVVAACETGKYGQDCYKKCGPCKSGLPCDQQNGSCTEGCAAGWKRDDCTQKCQNGTFGYGCSSRCGHCQDGAVCDPATGQCPGLCQSGWLGVRCDQGCKAGTYGQKCFRKCGHCSCGTTCDQQNGSCRHGCAPGWEGIKCTTKCKSGTYGKSCSSRCGHCRQEAACDHVTGMCAGTCAIGMIGSRCDINVSDFQSETNREDCEQKCGTTCDVAENGTCTNSCAPGWKGDNCTEKCYSGTYGYNCSSICGHCNENEPCDHVTGSCPGICAADWLGSLCDVEKREVLVNVSVWPERVKKTPGEGFLSNLNNDGHRKQSAATASLVCIVMCISSLW